MSTQDDRDSDELMFSRTGFGTPVGKLEDRFVSYCDIDTGLAFRRKCSDAGQTPSEAIRDFKYLAVHGMTYVEYCLDEMKRKRQAVFGTGLIEAPKADKAMEDLMSEVKK